MYLLQQENLFDEQSSAGEGDHRTRQLESAHAHTCNLFIIIKLCSVYCIVEGTSGIKCCQLCGAYSDSVSAMLLFWD